MKPRKKEKILARLTLSGLAASKTQRFQDDVIRHRSTTNLTQEWLYARLRALLTPSDFIACETCGMDTMPEAITIDHIFPKSKHKHYTGNIHDTENLQLICPSCNSAKGQRSLDEFLKTLNKKNDDIYRLRSSGAILSSEHGEREIIAPPYPNIGFGRKIFNSDSRQNKSEVSTRTDPKPNTDGPRDGVVGSERKPRKLPNDSGTRPQIKSDKTKGSGTIQKVRRARKRHKDFGKKVPAGTPDSIV